MRKTIVCPTWKVLVSAHPPSGSNCLLAAEPLTTVSTERARASGFSPWNGGAVTAGVVAAAAGLAAAATAAARPSNGIVRIFFMVGSTFLSCHVSEPESVTVKVPALLLYEPEKLRVPLAPLSLPLPLLTVAEPLTLFTLASPQAFDVDLTASVRLPPEPEIDAGPLKNPHVPLVWPVPLLPVSLVKLSVPLPEPLTDEILIDEPETVTDVLPEYLPLNLTVAACATGDAGAYAGRSATANAAAARIAVTAAGAAKWDLCMEDSLVVLWWVWVLICGSFRLDTSYTQK